MKTRFCALMAVGVMLFPVFAAAEGYQSIITNTEIASPLYEPDLLMSSDMNNPNEQTRFEGLPQNISGGNRSDRNTSWYDYENVGGDRGYCTKFTSAQGGQPYMQYTDTYRVTGTVFVEFDLMVNSAASTLSTGFYGQDETLSRRIYNPLIKITTDKTLNIPSVTNEENYKKYEKIKANQWYRVKMMMHTDENTCSIYITDGDEFDALAEHVPVPGEGSIGCIWFRLFLNTAKTASKAECFVDNFAIYYDSGYNLNLLRSSYLTKLNSQKSMAYSIGVLVDRYNNTVCPIEKNGMRYLPLRFVADCFHAKIEYDEASKEITVIHKGRNIMISETGEITIDGTTYQTDAPMMMLEGRCFLSIKTLADILNTNVYYDKNYTLVTDFYDVTEEDFRLLTQHMEDRT